MRPLPTPTPALCADRSQQRYSVPIVPILRMNCACMPTALRRLYDRKVADVDVHSLNDCAAFVFFVCFRMSCINFIKIFRVNSVAYL